MKRTVAVLLGFSFLICLLLAAGCEDSKHPLSDPAKSSPDKHLIGVWQHQNDGSTTYYLVGILGGKAPESMMRVVIVTQEKSGELQKPAQAVLFPTTIDGTGYLNLVAAKQEELAKIQERGWQPDLLDAYFILKYRLGEGVLLVWPMDNEANKKAVEAGKITGETKKFNGGEFMKFADTTQNLAQFVAASKDELFAKEPLRFERVK